MKSRLLSCAMVLTLSLAVLSGVYAGSATWNFNPISGDWNTGHRMAGHRELGLFVTDIEMLRMLPMLRLFRVYARACKLTLYCIYDAKGSRK
jgi:hypothetical protein